MLYILYVYFYLLIGFLLTFYWNRDNDGMINATIMFGLFLWPVFLILFTPEFLSNIKFNYIEKKKICKWNEENRVGTCVRFTNKNEIPAFGKTIKEAYFYGIMGACVDVRDDEKDGKYTQDYICPVDGLKVKK